MFKGYVYIPLGISGEIKGEMFVSPMDAEYAVVFESYFHGLLPSSSRLLIGLPGGKEQGKPG